MRDRGLKSCFFVNLIKFKINKLYLLRVTKKEQMGIFEEKRLYRAACTLTSLFILAIIYVPICLIAKLKHYLLCQGTRVEKKNVTIVITGAKMYKSTLFVKWLGKAGYDIVLVETEKFWCSGSRFSKYVKKFYTVADALTKPEQYV